MKYGILRAACASPSLKVADCTYNAQKIIQTIELADKQNIRLIVFPELCITGYTCGDLFLQRSLQLSAEKALIDICSKTKDCKCLSIIGLPITYQGARYNCAAYLFKGNILAIVPKTYIPNYSEFYERRWFTPAEFCQTDSITINEDYSNIPFGSNIIIEDKKDPLLKIACEICEDVWVPLAPSTRHALNGATVIANLSASNEIVGKADYRRMLISAQSAKTVTAYLYANACHDESTTDMIFSGHSIIALNGSLKAQSDLFGTEILTLADIDLERIEQDRLRTTTFTTCNAFNRDSQAIYRFITVEFDDNTFSDSDSQKSIGFQSSDEKKASSAISLIDKIAIHPFVPEGDKERSERCRIVIEMQAEGLAKRFRHIHAQSAVIGLSGGLDSTLALLVTARAFDKCGIERSKISAVTMPCFGTTNRTYSNACALAKNTGAALKEINIKKAVLQHFEDIGHDENIHDVTYENCQARERTQILMDIANKYNGIVIGTGDLSELALGWCTYNGDQMSMYGVNSSIPKTLVRYLVEWFAMQSEQNGDNNLAKVLKDILATPVSPELLPPTGKDISQKTEELVGPYELHDFFLYYVLRWGFSPKKIFFLAMQAFDGKQADGSETVYTREIILKWLTTFYRRFFSQQFKRSCMPDGAKVGTVNLSPRGDWRMPSDASSTVWMEELKELEQTD
ncbi:MAG: NAD(+) synthase [Treponema sp.]|nr:NAD(+) synthase [Treponema sp.]